MSQSESPEPDLDTRASAAATSFLTWSAAVVAAAGVLGSVYLSVNMGLKACPLCLYQRIFVMSVLGVLVTGLMFRSVPGGLLCVLAVPMAVGGLATAGMHVSLESRQVIECPRGALGLGSAPQQSLGMFALLTLLLLSGAYQQRIVTRSVCAAALGGLLAWGAIQSAPPLPRPTAPYPVEVDKDGCRPVFVPNREAKS